MKKRSRSVSILIILTLALVLLAGCSSVRAVLKSNLSGIPYWYYEPQMGIAKGKVGMIGEGSASTQRQAELIAYNNVIERLSERIGSEIGQEAYRELSVLGTISEYGLVLEDSYVNTAESMYNVFLHVSIDQSLLDKATTDETKRRESITHQVSDLIVKGDEFVRNGNEIRAVSNYMKAMALSEGKDYIDSEYQFKELYPVVLQLLKGVTLTIVSSRTDVVSCVVSITRKGTFVSSSVASAEVLASYQAEDVKGVIYNDSFVYVSDENGMFVFNPINDSILRKGVVRFELNLSRELKALEDAVGSENVEDLRALIDSKTISFEYDKQYSMGSIAVAVIEHDNLGYVTGVRNITDYMTSRLISDEAKAYEFYAELDDQDDVFYEFLHSDRTENCLLVMRIGITNHVSSRNGFEVVGAEGIFYLFERGKDEPVYTSDVIYSSAFADTYTEAAQDAFKALADIAYSLVKAVYV